MWFSSRYAGIVHDGQGMHIGSGQSCHQTTPYNFVEIIAVAHLCFAGRVLLNVCAQELWRSYDDWTPLMAAVVGKHPAIAKKLLEFAAPYDKELVTACNRRGWSAVHLVCSEVIDRIVLNA